MMLNRIQVFVGTAKLRLALVLITACNIVACGWLFPRGTTKIAPDDQISLKGLTAKIEHRESCWDSCSPYDKISFFAGYKKLGEDFFSRELGLSYQPHTGGLIAFPRKAMFITTFSTDNDGAVVAGIKLVDDRPQIQILMGCLDGDRGPVSSYPIREKHHCAPAGNYLDQRSGLFLEVAQISYHYYYWIDYQTETFHEIASKFPEGAKQISVLGIDQARSHLVLLFSTSKDMTYSLCAYGNVGLEATYRCVEFAANDPVPPERRLVEAIPPKLPVPTSGFRFDTEDMTLVAARLAWLSNYFIEPLSLVPKTSTQIIRYKSGAKPPPIEKWTNPCGKCNGGSEQSRVEWPPTSSRNTEKNRSALLDFGSRPSVQLSETTNRP